MAKNTVYEWDPVAANNTDIAGINIQGSAAVSNFDNAFRTSMAQIKSGVDYKQVYAVKTGNYTALAIDNNAFHNFTGATPTLSLTEAATLGANWHYDGYSTGGPVIIDPNASELINGVSSITVPQGSKFSIKCDGSAFVCVITTQQSQPQIQQISASVAANALTVGWTPSAPVVFRNPTLTNGTPVSVTVGSALSLVVPSGATLGTTNAAQSQIALILLYNGGAPALGVVNLTGGVNLDETSLLSTTAIETASDSAGTVYSASAVTSSPFRFLGFVTSTQATAGTWASSPTLVQGAGGNSINGLFAPKPASVSGLGHFIPFTTVSGGGYALPSGGTWVAAWVGYNASTLVFNNAFQTAIAAGGSTIQSGVGGVQFTGFVWRIA